MPTPYITTWVRVMFLMKSKGGEGEETAGGASTVVKAAGLVGYFVALRLTFAVVQYVTYTGEAN